MVSAKAKTKSLPTKIMMHQSSDILILYDVPSSHAVEHRTMSLLLEKSATDLSQQKAKIKFLPTKIKMYQGRDILIVYDTPFQHAPKRTA